jgi:hypothetical protein
MYTVWHVNKYKITFKLVIDHWPRSRYRAAARRLRNTVLYLEAAWTICNLTLRRDHEEPASHL